MYIWIWHSCLYHNWLNQEPRLHYGTATLCSKQLVDCYLKRFGAQDALTQLAWYTYHRRGSLNSLKEFIWVRVWHVVSCHTCSLASEEAFIQNIPSVLKMPHHLCISKSSLSPCIPSGATWLSFFVQKLMIRLPLAMMTRAQVFFCFLFSNTRNSSRDVMRSDFLRPGFYRQRFTVVRNWKSIKTYTQLSLLCSCFVPRNLLS